MSIIAPNTQKILIVMREVY